MTDSNVVKLPQRKAEDAGKAVADFAREHPALVVAGGVAIGLVIGGLLAPRGTGRKLADRALTLAEAAGAASLALSRQAADRAEDVGHELRKQGHGLRKQGHALADKAGRLAGPAEDAVDHAGEAAQRLLRKAMDLAGKLRA